MEGRDGMRAGDADRQETAERLRLALEEGRLDLHEYDERLQRAYAAKTYAELGAVLADLPGPALVERSNVVPHQPTPPAAGARPAPAVAPASERPGWLLDVWLPWLRVAAIVNVIWLLSSLGSQHVGYYWPAWVLGPWGALLVLRTVGGVGSGELRRDAGRRTRRAGRGRRSR
ncbi:DUF1707 domain-containing protein [Micromonospora sp. R77]|uniref:DUF1707 domain-containing protein n=1 Tax=Micromonospora sp. R77 TaxID=2925836 RepID=UPI001F60872E|nr:DUF1707 domain-containing protein [Micromonospora sp. R77]MCI4062745.1 DUF1707 domain-containing protein [Micromonospora sp. R77]